MDLIFEPNYVCTRWHQVLIQHWRGPLTKSSLATGRRVGDEIEAEFGPHMGSVVVLGAGIPLPHEEARAEAARILKETDYRASAKTMVIPGTGFGASALRAAYSTMNLLARSSVPSKVVSNGREAAAFVCKTMSLGAAAEAGIVAEIERAAAALDAAST